MCYAHAQGLAGRGGALLASGCGYNRIQQQDEAVKAAWSEVINQYQRRADLVPNLVNTVKGFAAAGAESTDRCHRGARASVGTIQATPELVNDPAGVPEIRGRPGAALAGTQEPDRRHRKLSAAQVGCRIFAICRHSSRAPRIASRSRAIATSRRSQEYNISDPFVPDQSDGDDVQVSVKQNFTVQNEAEISRPPTVDFSSCASRRRHSVA